MNSLVATAPGKVILFGEHAVVYGKPAIAVPVSSLRASAEVSSVTVSGLHIHAKDIGDDVHLIDSAAADLTNPLVYTARLVLEHFASPAPNVEISVKSQIPIASGLGSGAAISAALARTVALVLGQSLDNDALNPLVYEVEKIHHGTPSGIDNTVIVYEQPVYFVRDKPIDTIHIARPFHLLIAESGQRALTKDTVGDVRKLFEAEPERVHRVFDRIGDIVNAAREKIKVGEIEEIGLLMQDNHALLRELTVSSAVLDRLVSAALGAGALGAKLSGGGRGGNIIALVSESRRESTKTALLQAGAVQVISTTVD